MSKVSGGISMEKLLNNVSESVVKNCIELIEFAEDKDNAVELLKKLLRKISERKVV